MKSAAVELVLQLILIIEDLSSSPDSLMVPAFVGGVDRKSAAASLGGNLSISSI